MASTDHEYATLKELGNSNYEIAEGEFDIRGWNVKNNNGNLLGKVSDLLFNSKASKIDYLVLNLEDNELHLEARKVLIPLSIAELHGSYKNVILPGVMATELTSLPTYEKGKITMKFEELVKNTFLTHTNGSVAPNHRPAGAEPAAVNTFYGSKHESVAPAQTESKAEGRDETPQAKAAEHRTVVGIFDHTNPAQSAVEYLTAHGFNKDHVHISNRDSDHNSISGFFKKLFNSDDEADHYANAAKTGAVVTVHAHSTTEAEAAAEILDQYGSVNMDERMNRQNTSSRKYRSMIVDNPEVMMPGNLLF